MSRYTTFSAVMALEPMIGSLSDLSSSNLFTQFIMPVEGRINAELSRRYPVPIASGSPILEGIASDMVVYRALRRAFSQDQLKDSVWPTAFKEAADLLQKIAEGKVLLVNSAGTTIDQGGTVASPVSNTQGYLPTFHEGGSWMDQIKDANRSDDELNNRDITPWP